MCGSVFLIWHAVSVSSPPAGEPWSSPWATAWGAQFAHAMLCQELPTLAMLCTIKITPSYRRLHLLTFPRLPFSAEPRPTLGLPQEVRYLRECRRVWSPIGPEIWWSLQLGFLMFLPWLTKLFWLSYSSHPFPLFVSNPPWSYVFWGLKNRPVYIIIGGWDVFIFGWCLASLT